MPKLPLAIKAITRSTLTATKFIGLAAIIDSFRKTNLTKGAAIFFGVSGVVELVGICGIECIELIMKGRS